MGTHTDKTLDSVHARHDKPARMPSALFTHIANGVDVNPRQSSSSGMLT